MTTLTLAAYQEAEREVAHEEGWRGFLVHAVITAVVCAGLVLLNLTVADEFPWSIFPVVGMSMGLFVHWHFGVTRAQEILRRHQADIEKRAA